MGIKKLIAKIKSIKHIELYIAIVLAIVVVVIIFATRGTTKVDKTTQNNDTFDAYISEMENKLTNVIQKMEGCGNAKVAISYSSVDEKEYAYETQSVTTGSTEKVTTSVIIVNGKPLVIKSLTPTICGVVVVADGADNPIVRMKIIQLVVTLLGVSQDQVQVFTYKS